MRLEITGRHVDITPPLRQLIGRRLQKIERLLNDSAVSCQIILTKEKYRHRTEILVHARGDHVMRGLAEANAWNLSVRQAAEKVEQQAQKLKGKWTESKRSSSSRRKPRSADHEPAAGAAAMQGPRVVRPKRYPVKPMSIDDAALRLEGGADTFVVFRNAETDAISILYKRKDGNLGLVEPE